MRALSIIGIVMSVIGLITCIYIMTEAKCYCYCDNDNDYLYNNNSVPGDAVGGSMVNMLIFIFFLVMSIVGTSKSFSNKPHLAQTIPPFQANPYPNYQQPYQQPYTQQYQQNPYQQNPYQQNPYQNPKPPQQNPYHNPNPYQKPDEHKTPPTDNPPPSNPWEPK